MDSQGISALALFGMRFIKDKKILEEIRGQVALTKADSGSGAAKLDEMISVMQKIHQQGPTNGKSLY